MEKLQGFHEINSRKLRPVYPLVRFANFGVLNSALFSYLPLLLQNGETPESLPFAEKCHPKS